VTEQKKIFGTDGVRGVANVEPVTEFGFHILVSFGRGMCG
jgi:phosphomannomutase